VPTHAMHCRNPRRSKPVSSFFFVTHASFITELRAQEVRAPDEPCAQMPGHADECHISDTDHSI
jgi:hypothetical protein